MKTFKQFQEEAVTVNELFGLGKPKPKPKKSLARKVAGGAAKLAGKAAVGTAKVAGKVVKKVGTAAVKGAAGAVKGAAKGIAAGLREEEEVVTELNRYGKETGKATGSINKRAGTPIKKGGSTDKALNYVRTKIRNETGKPEGQQKKVKGEKGRVQYGDRKGTPADSIAKRRASKAAADAAMRDTRGT
tara:strand:- start:98 stop:661 length:564 start_codon:yes stop_codon:yes gene_type:complete